MIEHEEDFTRLIKCRTKHETKTHRRRGTMPFGLGNKTKKNRKNRRYKTLKIEEKKNKRKNRKVLFLIN